MAVPTGESDALERDMADFFGKKEKGDPKERVVKGMNLWDKKQVTISGERIAKVDRVASQVAKLIVELRDGSVPLHNPITITEYLNYLRNLCDLADVYISSKPIGCGLKFRVNKEDVIYVGEIEQGSPAFHSEIKVGDQLWQINGKDVWKWDFQDMAEVYLGRVGTVVELMMKRPTQPHPVTATLRRQEGEYMSMQHLAIPVSSLDCNLHPYKILERIRFAEKTLLQIRFEIEEWGAKRPITRLSELKWHQSVLENETARFHHRLLKLAVDLGLNVRIYQDVSVQGADAYDKSHSLRDPFAQLVWRSYFHSRPVVKMRELLAAVQNELRNLGAPLLSSSQSLLVAKLLGISLDDCLSTHSLQSLIDRWFPPCRFSEVASLPWPHAGHGLVDAIKLAELNLINDTNSGVKHSVTGGSVKGKDSSSAFPDWFYPFLGFQEATFLLTTADPGTFVVRYSKTPGNFAVQWTSAGRQVKNAKIFAKTGGFSWRHDGKVVYGNLAEMIHEVHAFLSQGVVLPVQRPTQMSTPLAPDDD